MGESYTRTGKVTKVVPSGSGKFLNIDTKKADGSIVNNKFSYFNKEGDTAVDIWEGAEIDFTFYITSKNGTDFFNISKINSVSGDRPEPKQEFKPNYGGQNKYQSKLYSAKTGFISSTKDSKLEAEGRLLNTIIMEVFKIIEPKCDAIAEKVFNIVEPLYKKCSSLLNEKSDKIESSKSEENKIKDIPKETNEINF